jgi:hypothetical protein
MSSMEEMKEAILLAIEAHKETYGHILVQNACMQVMNTVDARTPYYLWFELLSLASDICC